MTRLARPLTVLAHVRLPLALALVAALACFGGLAWAAEKPKPPEPARQLGPPPGAALEESEPPPAEVAPAPEPEPPPPPAVVPEDAPIKRLSERVRSGAPDLLDIPIDQIPTYRGMMRDIVVEMSKYARGRKSDFVVLVRGGFDLLFWSQREYDQEDAKRDPSIVVPPETIRPVGMPMRRYIQGMDGFVMDGQICSPLRIPRADLKRALDEGLKPTSLEHCKSDGEAIAALEAAAAAKMVTFAEGSDDAEFKTVPRRRPIPENPNNVLVMNDARNMLPLFSSKMFASRDDWLAALRDNNYDVLVIDPFDRKDKPLTKAEVYQLKFKRMGARRLVFAHLDIGHADDGRFYFQPDWQVGTPSWLVGLGSDYPGEYIVEFWNPAWKAIVGKYFAGIMDLGFDGVMLDGVDAYRRWEARTPLTAKK